MAVIIVNQANLQICEIIFRYLYRIGAALPPHMGHARLVVSKMLLLLRKCWSVNATLYSNATQFFRIRKY